MNELKSAHCPVFLPQGPVKTMIRFIHALHHLQQTPSYQTVVDPLLPDTARFDPGHEAVMMGYDFHLTPEGPRLIEVNTNAGGALLAWQAQGRPFPYHGHRNQIMDSFNQEMLLFSQGKKLKPSSVIILDEEPEKQFLYNEMQAFAQQFAARGIQAAIVPPETLELREDNTLSYQGLRVDMIYNRHCDFYLQSEAMARVRTAFLNKRVCLSPHPRAYGLLADKRRMIPWSDDSILSTMAISPQQRRLILAVTPQTRILDTLDRSNVWQERRHWVFKPVSSHGGKGVLLGRNISKTRFDALIPHQTLAQRLVPPALRRCPDRDQPVKTDIRFFVYGKKILGVAMRIYHGQITTFREPGSGYAPLRLLAQDISLSP
ncbi:MAG: hypothetical protein HQL73_04455 [Magnetococcales bacterium]|nr:hypothetical protein [Magnetococcales bacterium]